MSKVLYCMHKGKGKCIAVMHFRVGCGMIDRSNIIGTSAKAYMFPSRVNPSDRRQLQLRYLPYKQ